MSEFLGYLCLIVVLGLGFLFATNQKIILKPNIPVTTGKVKLSVYKVDFYSGGKKIKTYYTNNIYTRSTNNKLYFSHKGKEVELFGDIIVEQIK